MTGDHAVTSAEEVLLRLAKDMRGWAASCRDVGDFYDEDGNAERAHQHWGKAEGYLHAAEMLLHEAAALR